MSRSFIIGAVTAVALALVMSLSARVRSRAPDPSGHPQLRYLAAPYLMLVCALAFLAAEIYEGFVPLNHRYSGNLLVLSYIPAAIGLLVFGLSAYFFTFCATLRNSSIELYRWPFGVTHFNLAALEATESRGRNTVLRVSGNRKFVVYYTYSGRIHFLSVLHASHSSEGTRKNPRAA